MLAEIRDLFVKLFVDGPTPGFEWEPTFEVMERRLINGGTGSGLLMRRIIRGEVSFRECTEDEAAAYNADMAV